MLRKVLRQDLNAGNDAGRNRPTFYALSNHIVDEKMFPRYVHSQSSKYYP